MVISRRFVSTKETVSLLAAPVEMKGQILPNLRNWQKRIRQRCLICTPMDSVSSIKTPRFLTDWENGMLWSDMDTGARLRVTWLILGLVPMATSSVLSWFIFNILRLGDIFNTVFQTVDKSWEVRGNTRVVELGIICKEIVWVAWLTNDSAKRLCVQSK